LNLVTGHANLFACLLRNRLYRDRRQNTIEKENLEKHYVSQMISKTEEVPLKILAFLPGIPAKRIKEHQGQSTATSLQKSKGTNGCRFGKF